MNRRILSMLAATVIAAGTVVVSSPEGHAATGAPGIPVPDPRFYTLAFDDEFNGTAVDQSVWNYRTDEKALSAQLPENVSEGGGVLTINLRKQSYDGYAYTGGGVVTKQSFRYGYYETRAKTPVGAGWHTSFWAQVGDGSTTFDPARRTEVDQFEIDSGNPSAISQGVRMWHADGSVSDIGRKTASPGFDTSAGWHTYGFDWNEDEVRFYVDGTLTDTVYYPPTADTHDFLNIWLTSIAYQNVDDSKLPATAQFDYVRYYQRDYYVDNDTPASSGYSEAGPWQNSSLPGFTVGNSTRYAFGAGATATWRPTLLAAGRYAVYVYKVVDPNSDPDSRIDVVDRDRTWTTHLNYAVGHPDWVQLGTWSFPAGSTSYVQLTGSGVGAARADAVKFVRVG